MTSRRILITGLSTPWGGRLARELERDEQVEAIIGIDTGDPRHALDRTEFVRVADDDAPLRRILRAARIDTVVETRQSATALVPLLTAAGASDSPVRKLVLRSSARVYDDDRDGPAFATEEMAGHRPPRGPATQSVRAAERLVAEFAMERPQVTTTVLRLAPVIGGEARGAHVTLLGLPAIPAVLGFDPRWQFVHEDDVIGALRHAVLHDLPGPYNVAADGVLVLSEIASLLGKPLVPVLPPWGTVTAATQLRRLGVAVPVELLADLRHGRALDNRRLKAAGYRYGSTSREAVLELRSHQRVAPLLASGGGRYRYEREVEAFLRWSPSVHGPVTGGSPGVPADRLGTPAAGARGYDDLTTDELLELIPSLEPDAIAMIRDHEARGRRRAGLLAALDHQLELRGGVGRA